MNEILFLLSLRRGVRSDASLVPPIRQTASIFKQPVTVYKTQESKVKTDLKHGNQEKPKQLFWEKRLEVNFYLVICLHHSKLFRYSRVFIIKLLKTISHYQLQRDQSSRSHILCAICLAFYSLFMHPNSKIRQFQALTACDSYGVIGSTTLPKYIKTLGPYISDSTTIQSLATALHVSSQPITGKLICFSTLLFSTLLRLSQSCCTRQTCDFITFKKMVNKNTPVIINKQHVYDHLFIQ